MKLNYERRNSAARDRMLAAIRRHLAASAEFDQRRGEAHARHEAETRADGAPGPHATTGAPVVATHVAPEASLVEGFSRALEAVNGKCAVVRNEAEAAEAVTRAIASSIVREKSGALRVAVSDAPLVRRVMRAARRDAATNGAGRIEIVEDATAAELFGCDVGITSAQRAVAETGTLVLESDEERHRLASLVPPVHIALVEAGGLRRTLGEVLREMSLRAADELSRTVTFITGSSRTSDIELTLAIGVHGPAELHVILIGAEGTAGEEM